MIPATIETHLRQHHGDYKHHLHAEAFTAQRLAESEHVSGVRVAKVVVLRVDGKPALAVVAASQRVNLAALEEALGVTADLVPEEMFQSFFRPCEPGSEPPLGLYGMPIFADQALLQQPTLLMPAGTHHDAVELQTGEWLRCESVQPIDGLGAQIH
jgi:Ala-tRNA(Pro) deacylase